MIDLTKVIEWGITVIHFYIFVFAAGMVHGVLESMP